MAAEPGGRRRGSSAGLRSSSWASWSLEYNEDPKYMRDLLLYDLTIEAQKCIQESGLSQNEVLRRTKTSASQLARLLDAANKTKSLDKMVVLLAALDCEVRLTVKPPTEAKEVGTAHKTPMAIH